MSVYVKPAAQEMFEQNISLAEFWRLVNGKWAVVSHDGSVVHIAPTKDEAIAWVYGDDWEPPTCGICDGYHGSVCPIEEPGYYLD